MANGPSPHEEYVQQTQMATLVWLALAGIIGAVLYLSYYFTNKGKKKEKKPHVPGPATQDANRPVIVAGGRRRQRMRVHRERDDQDDDDDDDFDRFDNIIDDDAPAEWSEDKPEGKIGVKKQRKIELKAEKRAEREAELEEREERKRKEILEAVERRKEELRKQQEDAERAEEDRLRKEEQEHKEYEEYLKLKESFVIEEAGEVGILSEEESQSLLQEFIDYVKSSKVILLEDLAAHFNLKTQEAIERLENLQEMGRLTGVMDDRGKFIYISEEELKNIAKFIKQRGRISISELADSSNTLIKLQEEKKQEVTKTVDVTA